jgi:hypothetical protein
MWKEVVLAAAAILAPATVLALKGDPLPGEYNRNAWFVGYYGEYFRGHHSFPAVFSTSAHTGVAVPVFYGYVLFQITGVLSAYLGSALGIRLVVVATLAVHYLCVRWASRRLGAEAGLAVVAACCTTWATYSLTNLYNRFALAEFFAGATLACACCCWMVFLVRPRVHRSWSTGLASGLFLALAAGTHPITGLFAAPIFAAIYLLHWFLPAEDRPTLVRRHVLLASSFLLVGVILAPWLYAYSQLGRHIVIGQSYGINYLNIPTEIAILVRLFPLPADYHQLTPLGPQLGVPYLETQINVPLLILSLVLLLATTRRLSGGARWRLAGALLPLMLLGSAAFTLSVWPGAEAYAPKMARKIEFAYRLVGLVNQVLLVGFLTALAFRSGASGSESASPANTFWTRLRDYFTHSTRSAGHLFASTPAVGPACLAMVVTLAACGMTLKVLHGRAVVAPNHFPRDRSDPQYSELLRGYLFGVEMAYATPKDVPQLSKEEARVLPGTTFPVHSGRGFGNILPVKVIQDHDGYVRTSAVPFRWAQIRVDGEPVPAGAERVWIDESRSLPWMPAPRVAVPVSKGAHTIEYAFKPPLMWRILNVLSTCVLMGWIVVLLVEAAVWLLRSALRSKPVLAPVPIPLQASGAADEPESRVAA